MLKKLDPSCALGFLLGSYTNVLTLGTVSASMAVAPSLRSAIQTLEGYTRLHTSYAQVLLSSNIHGLFLTVKFQFEMSSHLKQIHYETSFYVLQSFIESIHGRPIAGAEFQFSHPKPPHASEYADHFHGPVSFDAELCGMQIPSSALDEPSPYYNAEIWRDSQLHLARLLKGLKDSEQATYTNHVRALLRSFEPPLPELPAVAQQLHVSERTLNRRLKQEDISFRELRGSEQASWARRYLEQTDISIEAIACLLGYQDAANFRRAFKKRHDCSPVEFRNAQKPDSH